MPSENSKVWEVRLSFGVILFVFAVYFVFALVLCSPGLNAPMIYDSHSYIHNNSPLFARHDIFQLISFMPTRPLMMLTYYFNYITTGMNPIFFRLVNIAFLAAAGVSVALLAGLFLSSVSLPPEHAKRRILILAAILGLVFVVHPLQVLSALYIWQRQAIAASFFYYGAVATYVAARVHPLRRYLFYFATMVLFALGMFTKENVVTLPLALVLAEITVAGLSIRDLVRRLPLIAAITVSVVVLFLVATNGLHGAATPSDHGGIISRVALYYTIVELSVTEVLLTESRMLIVYLLSIIAPFAFSSGIVEAQIISKSFLAPVSTAGAVACVLGILLSGLLLLRKAPVISFGLLFFVLALIPESVLIPQYLFCGYRAILPMAGILLVAGQLILWGDSRIHSRSVKIACGIIGIAFILALCSQTFFRAKAWTPFNVWAEAYSRLPEPGPDVEKYPYLDIVVSFGAELEKRGDHAAAIEALQKATQVELVGPLNKRDSALIHMGTALFKQGKQQEGIGLFRRVLQADSTHADAHNNLGVALFAIGDVNESLEHLRLAVKYDPNNKEYRSNLALTLLRSGRVEESIQEYQDAINMNPLDWNAILGLAQAMEKAGNPGKAVDYYRKALEIELNSTELNFAAGNSFFNAGRFLEAADCYRRIVKSDHSQLGAHFNLATALTAAGQPREAVDVMRKMAVLRPEDPEVRYRFGLSLLSAGDRKQGIEHLRTALSLSPGHEKARARLEALSKESENAKPD